MPQLDQFTYLTQLVWLCVFYCTLDVLLFHDGLPLLSRRLKLRSLLSAGVVFRAGVGQHEASWGGVVIEGVQRGVGSLSSSEARACQWLAGKSSAGRPRTKRTYGALLGEIGASSMLARAVPALTSGYAEPAAEGATPRDSGWPAETRKKINRLGARRVLLPSTRTTA
uniref:H(+)-transporting two-sector ATPase n=1 Tax=Selaginella moellendorffii TaxID=88036 RepID=F2YIA4_SELML|nr:ATP synthase subunit 8 [Selaginella moellendorffii]AEA29864.1 ATP synthase subunit 8 [Selaginella moellendorffii]